MTFDFKKYCRHQHDVVCNQQYDDVHPYSFHLALVYVQYNRWKHLLEFKTRQEREIVENAIWGHDLIEDERVTYNDIKNRVGERTADIIFGVTDSQGKTRAERKDDAFWKRLTADELSVFVKLCDVMANALYSYMTGSSMYDKYGKEFPDFKMKAFVPKFKPMFDQLEKILSL